MNKTEFKISFKNERKIILYIINTQQNDKFDNIVQYVSPEAISIVQVEKKMIFSPNNRT